MVRVRVFNREGQLVGPVEMAQVELNDAQWRARLTPEQFRILRSSGTERPGCGLLLDNKQAGVYTCAGCGLPLFSSEGKFHSGTGWPSFFQPIAKENVAQRDDASHGMLRSEINCARCDGHLGHVFDDGPRPTGLRYCLNSESLNFTPGDKLGSLADPAAGVGHVSNVPEPSSPAGHVENVPHEQAVFAGGCFWCTEAAFEQLAGVTDVVSGYTGGRRETANYEAVCGGNTEHAEAIRITYDPRRITFDRLLDVFFDAHDPTQLNGQGNDAGTQYRSTIFYASEAQRQAAEQKIAELNAKKAFPRPIVTTLEPLGAFYDAEPYHQDYARHNPNQPYIQLAAIPKACKIREKYRELIKPS